MENDILRKKRRQEHLEEEVDKPGKMVFKI
jgi:hypothetical protein